MSATTISACLRCLAYQSETSRTHKNKDLWTAGTLPTPRVVLGNIMRDQSTRPVRCFDLHSRTVQGRILTPAGRNTFLNDNLNKNKKKGVWSSVNLGCPLPPRASDVERPHGCIYLRKKERKITRNQKPTRAQEGQNTNGPNHYLEALWVALSTYVGLVVTYRLPRFFLKQKDIGVHDGSHKTAIEVGCDGKVVECQIESSTTCNRLLIPVTIADGIRHKANTSYLLYCEKELHRVSVLLARLHQVRIHSSSSNSHTCVAWFIKFTKPQHTNVHFASIECGSSIICYLNKDGLLNVRVFECCWTMAAEKHYMCKIVQTISQKAPSSPPVRTSTGPFSCRGEISHNVINSQFTHFFDKQEVGKRPSGTVAFRRLIMGNEKNNTLSCHVGYKSNRCWKNRFEDTPLFVSLGWCFPGMLWLEETRFAQMCESKNQGVSTSEKFHGLLLA
ncbi:hypothetical protein CDAR_576611 [Caerostris darwini]|uniref:Uncharacterized protein n=1 Tax=Caerostris darwini TaxID=1538125 RepID=A0AAV4TKE6_9ARAC|nr:hypothetical protein CDAR_576611 [Caerostris darwini]